jgi:hypothetical protein
MSYDALEMTRSDGGASGAETGLRRESSGIFKGMPYEGNV